MRRPTRTVLHSIADVVVPVFVALLSAAIVLDAPGNGALLTLLGVTAAVAEGTALFWRRSRPELVMAITLAGGTVVQLVAPDSTFPLGALVAIGSVAAVRPPRISLWALAGLLAVTALNFLSATAGDTLFAMAVAVVVWALAEAVRNRRVAIDEAGRRAAGEEQARIARELHDVIAHSVSVIVVQAAAADDVFDERPDQARAALRSIETAGRGALAELRRLLTAVRPGPGGDASHRQPGLDGLDELTDRLRAAGLDVAIDRERWNTGEPLPAEVDLSAFRIVQEALTNTLRHGGASHAEVSLRNGDGILELDVRDEGRAAAEPALSGSGRGIAGMRERAAMLGGTLDAGPLPGGGFRVRARLPLEDAR